jgi:hypothetical protein
MATNSKPSEYNKSNKWGKKKIIFFNAFLEWSLQTSRLLYHILFNQMHYMNIAKHRCMNYLSMKEN